MGIPITQYRIVRKPFPCSDPRPPLPGDMWVFLVDEAVQAVSFLCPCGCGLETYTPIRQKDEPRVLDKHVWDWVAPGPILDGGAPQLSPSIRWLSRCKSHFNIEAGGKVLVHSDSGR